MYDYEIEYKILEKFERKRIADKQKTLIIIPDELRFNRIVHLHGYSFRVINEFRSLITDLSHTDRNKFGVIIGTIEASCEHPEFNNPYYGTIIKSNIHSSAEAIKDYIESTGRWDITKAYRFIEIDNSIDLNYTHHLDYKEKQWYD